MFVVCSDEARNGKTLTARLLMDHLLVTGRNPFVFDCDEPRGRIKGFYPDRSMLISVEKTSGQIRLFDTILAEPDRDYVVDLPAHALDTFFTVIDDLDFVNAAHDVRIELVIVYVLDQTAISVMTARDLRGAYAAETFYLIRNAWNGNPLVSRQAREVYEEIEPDAVFSLPLLDRWRVGQVAIAHGNGIHACGATGVDVARMVPDVDGILRINVQLLTGQ